MVKALSATHRPAIYEVGKPMFPIEKIRAQLQLHNFIEGRSCVFFLKKEKVNGWSYQSRNGMVMMRFNKYRCYPVECCV